MAVYHLSVKAIGRSAGRSATAAAAYRAAGRIADERTGLVHDYSRKGGVLHSEIVLPERSPEWAQDRVRLWNAAELAETRKNSTVAREVEVALPVEFTPVQRRELALVLARELTERHRCAVDVAIHAPNRDGDQRNHHAHLLMTTRRLGTEGFTEKTRELDDLKTGEVTRWRERWATLVNERLAEHGHSARVDHRSLEEQGIDREPTRHKGLAISAMERRGEYVVVSERLREEANERLALAAELGRLERESRELKRSIIDTSTALERAIAERNAERSRSVEQIREDARTAWLAARAEQNAGPSISSEQKPRIELSIDLAAARRAAREQWLAQRSGREPAMGTFPPNAATEEKPASRLVLPDDDLAK
jgi:hypothetical protein